VSEELEYLCINDACAYYNHTIYVPRDEEATCPRCGWFMSAKMEG